MFLSISVFFVTLWYLVHTSRESIYKKDIYAFMLILVYLIIYLNTPSMHEDAQILNKFNYVFSLYPVMAYFMILFPKSIFIPLHELFPDLPDYLAERAIIVFSYVSLVALLLMLVFVKLSHL